MIQKNNRERRRFVRGDFPYKVFIYSPKGSIISTHSEDISEGGVRVVIDEKLAINSIVDIEIFLEHEESTACKGRIVWTKEKKTSGQSMFDTGIEFCEVDRHEKK